MIKAWLRRLILWAVDDKLVSQSDLHDAFSRYDRTLARRVEENRRRYG